jgi:major membrane immunogen (membrane-anchored lipoprotein)
MKDGTYKGISRSVYTDEPYYGHSRITIEDGRIASLEFFVRDSAKQEFFNEKYEKYFAGNDLYIRQCRNDWKGIRSYPDSLLKYQNLEKVDVITGATWSYNLFKASVKDALSAAEKAAN